MPLHKAVLPCYFAPSFIVDAFHNSSDSLLCCTPLFFFCINPEIYILFYSEELSMSTAVSCIRKSLWISVATAIYVCMFSIINITPTKECVILLLLYESFQNTYSTYSTVLNCFDFMPVVCDVLIPSVSSLKWRDIWVGLDSNLSLISFSVVSNNFCMYLPVLWPQFYKLYPLAILFFIIPYDNVVISEGFMV